VSMVEALKEFDVRNYMGKLTCPVLVIRGLGDKALDSRGVWEMSERLQRSRLIDVEWGQYWFLEHQDVLRNVLKSNYGFLYRGINHKSSG
jgi:pimeloyl-ACP methyl ester carboxylesterase